jgi:putative alpha/beta hydrolase R526
MKRFIVFSFISILGWQLSYANLPLKSLPTEKEKIAMLNEADDFIDEINDGRQDRQSDAIYHAIQGQPAELIELRNSRNTATNLSDKVERKDFYGEGASRSVAMRLYRPFTHKSCKLPLLIYFHGGGWTIGSLNSCAKFCDVLAASEEAIVLAVDYSLAPEKSYPHGLLDCVSAVEYAFSHADEWGSSPDMVSVGGDSSGANLALATAMYLKDDSSIKNRIKSLVLFYPVVKAYPDGLPSWKKFSRGYGLDARLMEAFNKAYVAGGDAKDPLISPGDASDDKLKGLPPMLLIGAERDILVDQGKEFYDRVKKAGKDMERIEFPGAVHLFITVPGQATAFSKAVELTAKFLK